MKLFSRSNNLNGNDYGVVHLACEGTTESLLAALTNELGDHFFHSTTTLKELASLGSIYLNDRRVLHDQPIEAGDTIRIHTKPRRFEKPSNLDKSVVLQTDDFAIINKAPACHIHATVDNVSENLLVWLKEAFNTEFYITHRLDFETSGLLLLAKNPIAQSRLNEMFRSKQIYREYWALSPKAVSEGVYLHYMLKSPKAPKEIIDAPLLNGSNNYLSCEMQVLENHSTTNIINKDLTQTEEVLWAHRVKLFTGRPQQIRAQFAHLKSPLLGDLKYKSQYQFFHGQAQAIGLLSSCMKFEFMDHTFECQLSLEEWWNEHIKIIFDGLARP